MHKVIILLIGIISSQIGLSPNKLDKYQESFINTELFFIERNEKKSYQYLSSNYLVNHQVNSSKNTNAGNLYKTRPTTKKAGINDLLWFIGKVFLAIFPFIFTLMIIRMFVHIIALVLNYINKNIVMIFYMMSIIFNVFYFGFLGAYYRELYEYYSHTFKNEWIIYIVCLLAIMLLYRESYKELLAAKYSMNNEYPYGVASMEFGPKFSNENLSTISKVYNFKASWVVIVSFILFSILPSWITMIYGRLPNYLATLFN